MVVWRLLLAVTGGAPRTRRTLRVGVVPFGLARATRLIVARRASRAPSRRLYLIVPALVGAVGTGLIAEAQSQLLLIVAITIAAVGLFSAVPVFWGIPTALLSGTGAAA